MPQLDAQAWSHLWLLLLIVPAQYLVVLYNGSTESQRATTLHGFLHKLAVFKENYFSLGKWGSWCLAVWDETFVGELPGPSDHDMGESPAVEVLQMDNPKGYFGSSLEVRSLRPSELKYRVGQVITHKTWGYRGVIIGWDLEAKAPPGWLKEMHPADKSHWASQPNYSILVDTRDRLTPQATYIPQENIEIVTNTQIIHPSIDSYFEIFDGAQYKARPWLQSIYPYD